MEEELFELLSEFVEESKKDKKFLNGKEIILPETFGDELGRLIDIIAKYNTHKYLRKFCIYKTGKIKDKDIAFYNFKHKEICVFIEGIIDYINRSLRNSGYPKIEWYKMIYNEIFQSILHEREHSNQYALILTRFVHSLEKDIIKYTNVGDLELNKNLAKDILKSEGIRRTRKNVEQKRKDLFYESEKIYDECYSMDPMERLAEIKSQQSLEKMYRDHAGYEFYYSLAELFIKRTAIRGYKVCGGLVEAPTIMFMERISKEVSHDDIPFDWYDEDRKKCLEIVTNNFSFDERYLYGLPITNDEYALKEQELKKFTKKFQKFYSCKCK